METINEFFSQLGSYLWGWPMIVLLLGTHVFLTFRLKVPQRKLFTAIRLSIKKDSSADGDVSQFGALATALAATIGTVLADGHLWHGNEICGGTVGREVSCKGRGWALLWRSDVCVGAWPRHEMAGSALCCVYGFGIVRYWLHGAGQFYRLADA